MSEYKEMTLSQCAEFDKQNGLKDKLTVWGMICKSRYEGNKSKRGLRRRGGRLFQKVTPITK